MVEEDAELPPAIILMDRVSRRFGDVMGVDNLSLAVTPGTILGIVGPSGSGKTTAVRLLTGGLAPTSGQVRTLGEDPRRFHRLTRERIGYMPQSFVLYPELTVSDNVHFMGSMFGMLWRRRRVRVRQVLELVELWDVRRRPSSQLSGGMRRRLALACTLVHEPKLLFLDEPTAGIDPMLRQTIWAELRHLRNAGSTVVVTTQYVGEADYCDAVALITGGQLAALSAPQDLRRRAMGGDVVEVMTTDDFDVSQLGPVTGVLSARAIARNAFLVNCQDAGTAIPGVLAAVRAAGGEVISSREYRPSFDEIFTVLVNRHQGAGEATAGVPFWRMPYDRGQVS